MLKRYVWFCSVFITLFSFVFYDIQAYDFKEVQNESGVNNLITEIYDSKEQYEDLAGEYETSPVTIRNGKNTAYWWPVGSQETTEVDGKVYAKADPIATVITSEYGQRIHPITGVPSFHSGVDISGSFGNGEATIVAAKDGVVVYPTSDVSNNCPSSTSLSDCGGGYGNYVIIQHSDGNYTLYAHLHAGSITVTAGESVEQGQVIATMGSSGNSTGTHLHFEVRQGQNASSATVNPLEYISLETPRSVSTGGEFLKWLNSWEGHTTIDGDYYIVENIGDGVRTVGGGVTLESNPQLFEKYGMNINDYPVGSKIEIAIVDQMEMEIVNGKRSYVEGILASESIVLEEHQIQALISQTYNIGNIQGFVGAYQKYGNTQDLFDNWMFRAVNKGTQFEAGLTRRRNAEWAMFHSGEYVYNG